MEELNDYELLEYINENDENSYNLLLNKYKPLIISITKKYAPFCIKYGLERNDLIQEGMVGFYQAINKFNTNSDVKFSTFAKTCIERKIINTMITAKRDKNKILNESYALVTEDEEPNLENFIGDYTLNPENIILDDETEKYLLNKLYEQLSPYEEQVFELKKGGFNYKEISEILEKTPKNVDNTIQRIRNKFKKIIYEYK